MAMFEVVFHGQVRPGIDPAQARARIGQLFQVDANQLDVLFSGRRIVIKKGLDEAAAQKYLQAIERAGALCVVQPEGTGQAAPSAAAPARQAAAPAPTPAPVAAQPEAAASADRAPAPRDEFMAAFADVDAPNLPVAELGADMQDSYRDYAPLEIDLSAFSLAPVGSDLGQLPRTTTAAVPDTDHLRIADEDED